MFRNCLARQINEVDSLQSMFCGQDELTLWNQREYDSLKNILNETRSSHGEESPEIAFQLQIPLTLPSHTENLVVQVSFPAFYPSSDSAVVHLSFYPLTPKQEIALREAALKFVASKLGHECILDLVQFAKDWIYDHTAEKAPVPTPAPAPALDTTPLPTPSSITLILPTPPTPTPHVSAVPKMASAPAVPGKARAAKKAPAPKAAAKPIEAKAKPVVVVAEPKLKEQDFRRILIWFSTIAPDRSKTIAEWAKQLGLTGVSRLGSPALITVEGQKDDVDEYVSSLRSYRWKKMEIVWEEKSRTTNINSCRRFTNFQECMLPLPELQVIFKKANLEDMFKEGLKIRG
jgi:hypothetical protein